MVVVLPAPFVPKKQNTSPYVREKFISSTAILG